MAHKIQLINTLAITSGGTGAPNFSLFKSKLLLRACFCGLKYMW